MIKILNHKYGRWIAFAGMLSWSFAHLIRVGWTPLQALELMGCFMLCSTGIGLVWDAYTEWRDDPYWQQRRFQAWLNEARKK